MSFESPWPSVLSSRHWSMQRKYSLLAQKIQDKQIESERIYLLHLWGAGLRRLIRSRCTKRVMHTFTSSDKRPLTNLATIVRTLPSFIPWLFHKFTRGVRFVSTYTTKFEYAWNTTCLKQMHETCDAYFYIQG